MYCINITYYNLSLRNPRQRFQFRCPRGLLLFISWCWLVAKDNDDDVFSSDIEELQWMTSKIIKYNDMSFKFFNLKSLCLLI